MTEHSIIKKELNILTRLRLVFKLNNIIYTGVTKD